LNFDVVTDHHVRRNHHVLAYIAVRTDARVRHHMREVPDLSARPDRGWLVDIARFMHKKLGFFHFKFHRIATVTTLLGAPLITTRTCTFPVGASCGIFTLICHSPIYPRVNPVNCTSPNVPAICTHIEGWLFWHERASEVGTATVTANGGPEAGVPSGTAGLT